MLAAFSMLPLYLLDFTFQVLRPIHSLPFWHGARWSAWFRESCKALQFSFDDFALAITSFRYGKRSLKPNELLLLRLIIPESRICAVANFLYALRTSRTYGEFSAESLRPIRVSDLASAHILWDKNKFTGLAPEIFTEKLLLPKICRLRSLSEFSLLFTAPLRLALPPGLDRSGSEISKFCKAEHLSREENIKYLLGHIRHIPQEMNFAGKLTVLQESTSLYWDNMRYNPVRKIALGGVCGRLKLRADLDFELARRFVLGQYLGAGKNGRFGLGFWRIEEIDDTSLSSFPREAELEGNKQEGA